MILVRFGEASEEGALEIDGGTGASVKCLLQISTTAFCLRIRACR
jgi:hypothetical protein